MELFDIEKRLDERLRERHLSDAPQCDRLHQDDGLGRQHGRHAEALPPERRKGVERTRRQPVVA